MSKVKVKDLPLFGSVTVKTGLLAGMCFTVEDYTPVQNGLARVKYVAPGNGPRVTVWHTQVRGEFPEDHKAEDVRLAFSKLLPATIAWSDKEGYINRNTKEPLQWDRQLARFTPRPDRTTKVNLKGPKKEIPLEKE